MSKRLLKIGRYYHTLRYLKPVQHYHRGKLILTNRIYRYIPILPGLLFSAGKSDIKLRHSAFLQGTKKDYSPQEADEIISSANAITSGRFTFLNQTKIFEEPDKIDWNLPDMPQLWRFNLHYFDYARVLGTAHQLTSDEKHYRYFKALVMHWIRQNSAGRGDGWHPYTVSLRLVNWIYAFSLFDQLIEEDADFRVLLLTSVYTQARYLASNLEYHVLGNHLLENARALVFAGLFFDGKRAGKWLKEGMEILWQQAGEQILDDGGHFELSLMYHSIVLHNYLECINILEINGREIPAKVISAVEKMLIFQREILHPDGMNPLLNDSALDVGPRPLDVLAFGSAVFKKDLSICESSHSPVTSFVNSGYYILRNDKQGSFVIIDCGKPCPEYLPAHAHADILNYEMSLDGQRFIVDSGVYEYKPGMCRDYFRSTAAHNTVTVNGQNQSDVWGSFRVGKRGRPLEASLIDKDGVKIFRGVHDSYCQRFNIIHTRYFAEVYNSYWVVIDELDIEPGDREPFRSDSYIHFHPAVSLQDKSEKSITLQSVSGLVKILPFGSEAVILDLITGEGPLFSYSPEFGQFTTKLTLCLTVNHNRPVVLGYVIVPVESPDMIVQPELNYQNIDDYRLSINSGNPWHFTKGANR